jgi:hypothetical protein
MEFPVPFRAGFIWYRMSLTDPVLVARLRASIARWLRSYIPASA